MNKWCSALLEEVLAKQGDFGLKLLPKAIANELSADERAMVCQYLASELVASGIQENGEPTPRGLLIESAIDFVNRSNLSR